ncbi:MAG TPA: DUF2298 domain-containing protein [Anaerolineales bacterium]|nr:DUF2298 domain-containing protein [Anaerolineales bacterium]
MTAFLAWYLIITLLGWLTFPLVYALFPGLADRGYSLSRAAGLLLWGYLYWLLNSLGLMQNNVGGIILGLLLVAAISAAAFFLRGVSPADRRSELVKWLRGHLRLILTVEVLFLAAFAFEAFLRAGNPELDNAEKPMELMFINAILRSPTFPPHDSWLSGYAISYYYFGYVMTAMLAMLTGLTGSVAHNLMTSLIFGLAAIGAYGILYNLLAVHKSTAGNGEVADIPEAADTERSTGKKRSTSVLAALLGPLFLLLVSNLEGFLEVLHGGGVFWSGQQNFWTWLGILDLNEPPAQPFSWIPARFWWWWRASRVIADYDLAGNFREVIDEFPFFSFLHADLHPHVLAIPFNLLAVAVALNIVLGGWRGETSLFGLRLRMHKAGFLAAALLLGGLAFLNTWDILIAAALIVLAYVLYRVHEDRWSWARLEDIFLLGIPLGILAALLYLPFYFGFSSQAGGILPNLVNPTRGAQLWVMFAPLFIPMFAYLLYVWRSRRWKANWLFALVIVAGIAILLWAFSWLMGWLAFLNDPGFGQQFLSSQGMPTMADFFAASTSRRLSYIGGSLTLLLLLFGALAFLLPPPRTTGSDANAELQGAPAQDRAPVSSFIFLLIALGALLVFVPDFVYLRDQFGYRINTMFKFYYQAWMLWSIAAAFGAVVLLRELRGLWSWVFTVGLVLLLGMALTYPALAIPNKTDNFKPYLGWTLDDFQRIVRNNPDEAAAVAWLRSAPDGVMVEAVPDTGGSYTGYARISEYTGLPAVLGWTGHEDQWRGSRAPQGTRQQDIAQFYSTSKWETALAILQKYDIKYVYVGDLERTTYGLQEDKFKRNLAQVFHQGSVSIYEMP